MKKERRPIHFYLKTVLVFLAVACLIPSACTQNTRQLAPITPKTSTVYPDASAGLRYLLQDMLAAANRDDQGTLQTMILDTEIPDYQTWFPGMFGAQKGNAMAISYGKTLKREESYFQRELTKLAGREGYLTTREIVATDLYDTLQKQLDVFLASWSPPDSAGLPRRPTPIAYFFFVDGKFRLDTNNTLPEASSVPNRAMARQ